jgi:Flp pilus assembly pilin Flp
MQATRGTRLRSRAGQAMIEYVLLLSLIAVGLSAILLVLRNAAGNVFNDASSQVAHSTICPYGTQTGGSGQNSNGGGGNCSGVGGGGGLIGGVAGGGGVGGGSGGTTVPGGGGSSGGTGTGSGGNGNGKSGGKGKP